MDELCLRYHHTLEQEHVPPFIARLRQGRFQTEPAGRQPWPRDPKLRWWVNNQPYLWQ